MAHHPIDSYRFKQITDPVHTTIGISELEAKVLNCASYQRLRGIRQLGLAHLVFPGADYSRFAHSLGVCHVTGQIVDALSLSGKEFDEERKQKYRLAGLLHDIGHYPFSHAMEEAIADYYSEALFTQSEASSDDAKWLGHEDLGGMLLDGDDELSTTLKSAGHNPKDVAALFRREDPDRLKNLISSDFDADRIDYLMRTARHSGLPYGGIDLPYLLTQLRLDNNKDICLSHKAVRAADHFLLSRYFDYAQVAYHKTVAALELILKDAIKDLLAAGKLKCDAREIEQQIASGNWSNFSDASVLSLIEENARVTGDAPVQLRSRAIAQRRPPSLVWEYEELTLTGKGAEKQKLYKKLIRTNKEAWANKFGIPSELWKEWSVGTKLTKIGALVSTSLLASADDDDRDRYEQAVRILQKDGSSVPLVSYSRSLMSVLSQHEMVKVRLYVLVPPHLRQKIPEIRDAVCQDLD